MKKRGGWPGPAMTESRSFTLWVPKGDYERLLEKAGASGQSVGALVRQAIAREVKDGQDGPRGRRAARRSA